MYRYWGVAQVEECMLWMHKFLGSIASTAPTGCGVFSWNELIKIKDLCLGHLSLKGINPLDVCVCFWNGKIL